jgi:microcystin-dependent protein
MASTFSPSLRIELIGNGDQSGTWGTTTNNNLGTLIEQGITGVQSIAMINANYTLSNFNGVSDEARNAVLVVTGSNSAVRQIICPLVNKTYIVTNNTTGGFAITIGGATGSTVSIPNGVTAQVYCDGINFFSSQTGSAGNFAISGNLSVSGTTALSGALTGTTGVFSGAISAVSPAFTGTPTAPTAAAGTNTTQIATTAFVLANGVPTGGLVMWPTGSAPSGFLLCTGTAVSRTTYAALFAVVGTTFGSGDGSTTFNLPNYTNRMPYGTTVGATGGSADAVVVSHTHTATSTDSGHTHLETYYSATGGGFGLQSGPNDYQATKQTGVGNANITTTVNSTGSSGTGANLPPYLGINFIIKT